MRIFRWIGEVLLGAMVLAYTTHADASLLRFTEFTTAAGVDLLHVARILAAPPGDVNSTPS